MNPLKIKFVLFSAKPSLSLIDKNIDLFGWKAGKGSKGHLESKLKGVKAILSGTDSSFTKN